MHCEKSETNFSLVDIGPRYNRVNLYTKLTILTISFMGAPPPIPICTKKLNSDKFKSISIYSFICVRRKVQTILSGSMKPGFLKCSSLSLGMSKYEL